GLATLCEYLFDWSLGIDELLFSDYAGAYNVSRGRMSPYSAATIFLLGTSIACLRLSHLDRPARIGAGIGLTVVLFSLIGYIWNVGEFVTDRWLPPVALNTALCFIGIGVGILLTREVDKPSGQPLILAGVEIRILVAFGIAIGMLVIGGSFTYRNSF